MYVYEKNTGLFECALTYCEVYVLKTNYMYLAELVVCYFLCLKCCWRHFTTHTAYSVTYTFLRGRVLLDITRIVASMQTEQCLGRLLTT